MPKCKGSQYPPPPTLNFGKELPLLEIYKRSRSGVAFKGSVQISKDPDPKPIFKDLCLFSKDPVQDIRFKSTKNIKRINNTDYKHKFLFSIKISQYSYNHKGSSCLPPIFFSIIWITR